MTTSFSEERTGRIGPFFFCEQGEGGQRLTADTLLLADFALPLDEDSEDGKDSEERVLDLGTGSGAIPLYFAWKRPSAIIVGVEKDRDASRAALRNVEENKLSERVSIVSADIREFKEDCSRGSFSLIVSNPPYIKKNHGRISPDKKRAGARQELSGELKDFLKVSEYLLSPHGRAAYIFPVKRFLEMMDSLREVGLSPRRLRFIYTKGEASLFLVEARRKGTLKVEEPIYL